MCINYNALSKITIKNNYFLLHIDDLLNQLNGVVQVPIHAIWVMQRPIDIHNPHELNFS